MGESLFIRRNDRENPGKMLTIAALAVILLAAINIAANYYSKVFAAKGSESFGKGHERSVV